MKDNERSRKQTVGYFFYLIQIVTLINKHLFNPEQVNVWSHQPQLLTASTENFIASTS